VDADMHNRARFRLALLPLLAAALLLLPARPRAEQFMTLNPGLTVSYVFGRGLTYGFEVSLVWLPTTLDGFKSHPYGTGVTLDLTTNFRGLLKLGLGGELVGPLVGIEAGPVLVRDRGETNFGIGVTTWAGFHVMPFYGYTLLFGDAPNQHEVGTYLKLYLDPNGDGDTSAGSDDWD
jgi:hypothetical protein